MITCRCLSQAKKGLKILLTYLDLVKFIKQIQQQTGAQSKVQDQQLLDMALAVRRVPYFFRKMEKLKTQVE